MLSGRRLDLLDPSPFDIEIDDIAQGLARVARWNGQTMGDHAFSVAEHSVVVEDLCARLNRDWPMKWRMAALLHDAAEYVIGDMISPFKAALGLDYKAFEDRLETAIQVRFGLPGKLPAPIKKAIKQADRICAYFEATQIAGFAVDEAENFFGAPPSGLHVKIEPLPVKQAQILFLERFHSLLSAMESQG
ncbi:HD domain-containing protein [Woodsholea maritima]|uniref:HD domain-containing protein n=1 Tax=Woodsholea maritima TaxID=240237 RepID=UPI000368250E|nr:HD family hydrolase [Woodsholea maritima]